MCDIDKIQEYSDRWDDYFTYVNTHVHRRLNFEDDLYIAYGCYNGLPIEDLKYWFRDAETYLASAHSPDGYIAHKYSDQVLTEDDLDYFVSKEIEEGMLYEVGGYWFYA